LSQFLRDFLLSIKFKINTCTRIRASARLANPAPEYILSFRLDFVPRSLRRWIRFKSYTGIRFWSPKTLYRDGACMPSKLYPDRQKLRHASLTSALVALSS
jgi:hypothetical protein